MLDNTKVSSRNINELRTTLVGLELVANQRLPFFNIEPIYDFFYLLRQVPVDKILVHIKYNGKIKFISEFL